MLRRRELVVVAFASLAAGVLFKSASRGPHNDEEGATYLWMSAFPSRARHCVANRCRRLQCRLHARPAEDHYYYEVADARLQQLARWCSFERGGGRKSLANALLQQLLIYPGTKWCGKGNRARSYDDLGSRRLEDACCRAHDNCPAYLPPKTCVDDHLCNNSTVTMSHCDCDVRFHRCLAAARTRTADTISDFYFSALGARCIARTPTGGWRQYRLRVASAGGKVALLGGMIRWFLGA